MLHAPAQLRSRSGRSPTLSLIDGSGTLGTLRRSPPSTPRLSRKLSAANGLRSGRFRRFRRRVRSGRRCCRALHEGTCRSAADRIVLDDPRLLSDHLRWIGENIDQDPATRSGRADGATLLFVQRSSDKAPYFAGWRGQFRRVMLILLEVARFSRAPRATSSTTNSASPQKIQPKLPSTAVIASTTPNDPAAANDRRC